MRGLSRRRPQDERGATMVFVAVAISILFGFTALGVDLSHLTHERGRIQHAADAAALAVAYDCVSSNSTRRAKCDPALGDPTVEELVAADSKGDGGAITPPLTPASGKVTVTVDQDVNHFFAPVIGINTSDVHAKATVSWARHLVAGEVMPYAVSLCHWMHTAYNTTVTLDGGTNGSVGGSGGKSEVDSWKSFTNETQFGPVAEPTWKNCTGGVNTPPDGVDYDSSMWTIHDGLWFSESNCSNNISNTQVKLSLGETVCGSELNANQTGAADYAPATGETIPLAVYAPKINWAYGGLCAGDDGAVGGCADPPSGGSDPKFVLEIVGFVPFKVLGCHLGGPGGTKYDCPGGDNPADLGLRGQFVNTPHTWDGDYEYGETGNNFGAVKVELVD